MITFGQFIDDISKLTGIRLESIQPGAHLTINKVNKGSKRVEVTCADGTINTRPFLEFEKVWRVLSKNGHVHVDAALEGSGSRRNQPETIIAALPYIEWGRVARKKHLFYVEGASRQPGTLKSIDPQLLYEIVQGNEQSEGGLLSPSLVVVCDSLTEASHVLGEFSSWRSWSQEFYLVEFGQIPAWVGTQKIFPQIPVGTYLIIGSKKPTNPSDLILQRIGDVRYLAVK